MNNSASSKLRKRSVRISGHLTSVSMEEVFWVAFKKIAADRNQSINALITEIDRDRDGNLSSALRVFVFNSTRHI
jgi:predicted DNA-binding ribbon-helix-helix protein